MSATTHRIGRDAIHTYWSNALEPRLWVQPGETVVVETVDCNHGQVAREIDTITRNEIAPDLRDLIAAAAYPEPPVVGRDPSITGGHPLTGPIGVEGAEPGDTLVVEVLEIVPGAWGWNACSSNPDSLGLLNDDIGDTNGRIHHIYDLRNGVTTEFAPGIRIPISPFPGVIGVAPAEPGQLSTIPPRRNGGNMDLRHITAGSTLYLPVLAPGALLSMGDCHAAQGDGEVTGTGIEMDATLTLRLRLIKGRQFRQPSLTTAADKPLSIPGPAYVATGHNPDVREAAREALSGVLDYLTAHHGLTRPEAYMLASVVVDLKISQIVDRPNWTVGAYLPLAIFAE
ncbi:MAG: formamidase [Chloroflexi bacterium]|nr:MAG: formamidase [Chloroflexota bacterium]